MKNKNFESSRRNFLKGLSTVGVGATAGCIDPLKDVDDGSDENNSNQDYPRGNSTSYADSDESTMEEFRRFAEIQHDKSEGDILPPLPSFERNKS